MALSQRDAGTAFLLLHPSSPGSPPPVLQLLCSALRAHVDAAKVAAAAAGELAARPSRFHSITVPQISVEAYVERIFKYFKCSPVCLVMGFAYMQRLAKDEAVLRPSGMNVHRLLCTGVTLAAKFTDDKFFTNRYYAQVGGITLEELNRLELEMLKLLGYRAHVDVPELCACLAHLQGAAAGGAAWVAEHPWVCYTPACDPLEEAAPCFLTLPLSGPAGAAKAVPCAAAEHRCRAPDGCGFVGAPPQQHQHQQELPDRAVTPRAWARMAAAREWPCSDALQQGPEGKQGQGRLPLQEQEGEQGDSSKSSSSCSSPHTPRGTGAGGEVTSGSSGSPGAATWAHQDHAAFILVSGMGCGREQQTGPACREPVAVNAA